MSLGRIAIRVTTVDGHPAVVRLLALASGGDHLRLQRVVQRYRDERNTVLLLAIGDGEPVGVIGYSVGESVVTLLHIATALEARGRGVGTQLLKAVRRAVPTELPIVAETDRDAVGFYAANNFTIASRGEKYPGVERFRVVLTASVNPGPVSVVSTGQELPRTEIH